MLNNIKLTQKQQQVLDKLAQLLQSENYQQIPVSNIYCDMTAVSKVVSPSWFDRTFDKLIELGLVEKQNMSYEISGGYKKGEIVNTYCYMLTDLGFDYLCIPNPNKTPQQQVEDSPVQSQIGQFTNKSEYSIYPTNITTLNDVTTVIDILVNDVLTPKHRDLILNEIYIGYFKIKFNSKLKTTLGVCTSVNYDNEIHIESLEFNPNYIKYEPDNNLKIDTIIHEVCHVITNLENNKYCNHNSAWKKNCKLYNCSDKPESKITHYKKVMWEKGLISHRLICPNCSEVLEYINNPSKKYIKNVQQHNYYHRQCGSSNLILQQNSINKTSF